MKNQETNTLMYYEVPANPTIEFADRLINRFKKFDEIISIGGGSTIDVGKWIATKLHIYHKAIPTTAGTGSEVTSYAVLTTNGIKKTYNVNKPDEYELIPKWLESLDYVGRVSGALDALCHAIESQWSPESTPESIMYAQIAESIIWEHIEEFCKHGFALKEMLEAANYAGRAIEITATSQVHALSYYLTEKHNIPHGIAVGMMMADESSRNYPKVHNLLLDLGIDYVRVMEKVDTKALQNRAKKSERYTNI